VFLAPVVVAFSAPVVVAFLRGCCWLSLVLCWSGPVLVAVVVAVSGGCVAGDSGGDGD
jgi:hypothetical protein